MTGHEELSFDGRRVMLIGGGLVALGAAGELVLARSVAGALSLTGAGAVAIINFRWLEVVLRRVVQSGEPHFDRTSVFGIFGRMCMLALLFAALLWVPQVDPVAVALGFSALVAALLVEAFRWARVGGG